MSEKAGRYQRSAAGMVGAMVVLLLVIAAFVSFRSLNREEPEARVDAVDYEQSVSYAREKSDFALLAPESLPPGWRATSVEFVEEPARWHLGLLTDADRYVGLEQAPRSAEKMVEAYVDPEAVEGEPVQVAGKTWRTWTDEDGDTALVRTEREVTTLVVGTPEQDVLEEFVASLR